LARINVVFDEFEESGPISATLCVQCHDAACIPACPAKAIARDPSSGAVLIDEDRCIGCMICRRACPWDVPKLHPKRRAAVKCDLCHGRVGGPVCVAACPLSGRALRYVVEPVPERRMEEART
jgi:carbon-monoxide dehydrogenase iron sulfur subunit